jgi:hypothetical protein
MAFTSYISSKEIVIGDHNYQQYSSPDSTPEGMSRGYVWRDYELFPEGSFGTSFDQSLLIPRDEWAERIEEMERTKTRLSDLRRFYQIPSRNQNGTNYCWAHGPSTALILVRARMGLPYVDLSPASVAAPIKGGRNQGGWGSQALEYLIEHGIADSAHWPHNNRNVNQYLESSRENAALHKVTEWYELRPRNFDEYMSCLLHRIPVAIGLNWWSHEVCGVDPVVISTREFGSRIWNSWGDDWSDDGMGILTMSKSTPDDAVAPRVAIAA